MDPPLSPSFALRASLLVTALALGALGCSDNTTTPATSSFITLDTQRAVSEASSFTVSLQLDKPTYARGDSLKFSLALHNSNGVRQTLRCGYTTTQRYDIIVRDSTAHTQIWRFADDAVFFDVGGIIYDPAGGIADGDSVVYAEGWNQVGQRGASLVGGHLYSVTAFPVCVSSRVTPPTLTFTTRSGS